MTPYTSLHNVLAHQMLTEQGYRSVAYIVAEMQANGTDQRLIDRWLQGLSLGLCHGY